MYKWADDLVASGFGVDMRWKGKNEVYPRISIQKPELTPLRAVMRMTSDEQQEEFTRTGTLQGVDVPNHSFHFQYKDQSGKQKDIHGKFTEAISPLHPVKVPVRYTVTIRRSTRIFYSTDEEATKYWLLRIQSVKSHGKTKDK